MPIGKPTHPAKKVVGDDGTGIIRVRRGGIYKPRTGNSHGQVRIKKASQMATAGTKAKPVYVPPVKRPNWAKKYVV